MVTKDMVSNMPFLGGVGLMRAPARLPPTVALLAALLLAAVPTFRLSFQKVSDGLADGRPRRRQRALAKVGSEHGGG